MTMAPLRVHVFPPPEEQVYHPPPSDRSGIGERLDDIQEYFLQLQKELKALRGQYLFGNNAADLFLVPNVNIPHKFKVPHFEK